MPVFQVVQVPQVQVIGKIVENPEIQSAQDTHTSESLGPAPSRRVNFAESVDCVEIGSPLHAESVSPMPVTTPVVEVPPVVVEEVQPAHVDPLDVPVPAVTHVALALVAEDIGPTPSDTYAAEQTLVVDFIASAPAVSYAALTHVVEHIAPVVEHSAPVVEHFAPAPAVSNAEHALAPALAVTYATPARVDDFIAPAPAVTFAVPAPMDELVAPAPAVTYEVPAPVVEYVAPAPAVAHAALAPAPVVTYEAPASEGVDVAPALADEFEAPTPASTCAAAASTISLTPLERILLSSASAAGRTRLRREAY